MLSAGASAVMNMAAILMKAGTLCWILTERRGSKITAHYSGSNGPVFGLAIIEQLWITQRNSPCCFLQPFKTFVQWKKIQFIITKSPSPSSSSAFTVYSSSEMLFETGVACLTSASLTKVLPRLPHSCCFFIRVNNCQVLLKEREGDDRETNKICFAERSAVKMST